MFAVIGNTGTPSQSVNNHMSQGYQLMVLSPLAHHFFPGFRGTAIANKRQYVMLLTRILTGISLTVWADGVR